MKNKLKNPLLQFVVYFLFLPIVLIIDAFRAKRPLWKKLLLTLLIVIVFGGIWWDGWDGLFIVTKNVLYEAGITDELTEVPVSGASMLPAIKDGATITLHSPKKFGLTYGDVASFINEETQGLHYLKRIIGLPNDKITIKQGHVYINGQALQESYVQNNLPTFGNSFLTDCESFTVPADSYFFMGDNRTVSYDSRAIGAVKKEDIDGVIKSKIQRAFNPSPQQIQLTETIDTEKFVELLNEKRQKEKKDNLIPNTVLNLLTKKRADEIVTNFTTWKQEKQSVETLLAKNSYQYNLVHEYVTFGYLDEQALLDQIFDSPIEKDYFLAENFIEVGIGTADRNVGECTYPVISVLLSWPTIPTYDPDVILLWKEEIANTNTMLSNLQTWVGNSSKNQETLRKVITMVAEQNTIATRIHEKMIQRQWLSQKDYADIQKYNSQVDVIDKYAEELFGKNVKGASIKKSLPARI